jgi:hypothetical protein
VKVAGSGRPQVVHNKIIMGPALDMKVELRYYGHEVRVGRPCVERSAR